ncbi:MAG: M20/M25/M40 family metallo-hydrolase [Paracoccaceae bacterium]|nr:MAG: M20/M25/M40 family metallo-hydrolase [Paracoccaceae bacterium]
MAELDAVLDLIDSRLDASVADLLELIAIPSVSSEPKGAAGIAAAAEWLCARLAGNGFSARVVQTEGHPVVLGTSAPCDGPVLLFYGHYDVQPVGDPADWTHAPFAPRLIREDGVTRFYGRGASDSKSQHWAFVEALRAWHQVHGGFPGRIVILLEGEEESGSLSLPAFLETHRAELACDVAFICDAEMWSREQPALTTQIKGLIHERVTIRGPNPDLHSGHWGAVAVNPIRVLAGLLAGLHDAQGRVTIPGFYDGVPDIPPRLRAEWAGLAQDPSMFEAIDLTGGIIEEGYTPIEAMWGRPAIDFNGITGGNQGPERSVLPASATVRMSFRLVQGQHPDRIRAMFRDHVRAALPEGCTVEFHGVGGSSASVTSLAGPHVAAVLDGLEAEWGRPAVLKASGGAIPLVDAMTRLLGVDCVQVGFILGRDAIHAPDESYDVERLHKSIRAWARILARLQEGRP